VTARYHTAPDLVRRNGLLLLLSMSVTFVALRVWLHWSPNSDFNVGRYNIHHLFTGLVLIAAGGIPLAIFRGSTRRLDGALVVFGVGLAMALDEWVYLIATDGTNASYVLPVSLWGGAVVVSLGCVYALVLIAVGTARGLDRSSKA
jgi:hypothetical protein